MRMIMTVAAAVMLAGAPALAADWNTAIKLCETEFQTRAELSGDAPVKFITKSQRGKTFTIVMSAPKGEGRAKATCVVNGKGEIKSFDIAQI